MPKYTPIVFFNNGLVMLQESQRNVSLIRLGLLWNIYLVSRESSELWSTNNNAKFTLIHYKKCYNDRSDTNCGSVG